MRSQCLSEVMTDLEHSKYQVRIWTSSKSKCISTHLQLQNVEWRLSIYGRALNEWDKLAKWIVNNKLFSHNVRWLIQVPRLYEVYKANGSVENFEDIVQSELSFNLHEIILNLAWCRCLPTLIRGDEGPVVSSRVARLPSTHRRFWQRRWWVHCWKANASHAPTAVCSTLGRKREPTLFILVHLFFEHHSKITDHFCTPSQDLLHVREYGKSE